MLKFLSTVVFTIIFCVMITNFPVLSAWLTIGSAAACFCVLLSDDCEKFLDSLVSGNTFHYFYKVVCLYAIWSCYAAALCASSALLNTVSILMFINLMVVSFIFAVKRFA